MSDTIADDRDELPPLLRREVFDHPGGVDWLRTQSAAPLRGMHVVAAACLLLVALLLVGGLGIHVQERRIGQVEVAPAEDCGAGLASCVSFRRPNGSEAPLHVGAEVRLGDMYGTILRAPTSARDGRIAIRGAWTRGPGDTPLSVRARSSLLGWVFGHPARDARR